MSEMLAALAILGLLAIVGLPIALSIRGTRPEWTGLIFESLAIGLIIELLIALGAQHAGHYSIPVAIGLTSVVVAGSVVALRVTGARSGAPPPDLTQLRASGPALVMLATLGLVVGSLWIRRSPSYYIFQTGDMGGYVNSANVLSRMARFGPSPHGFPLFLRATNLLLGRSRTVAGLPALGAIFLLGVVAYARTIRLHAVVVLGAGLLVMVHPATVWYSLFPVSESLAAPLLLAVLYLMVRARAETSNAYAALAGVAAGMTLLVRGEEMLLAPMLVLLLLASAAIDEDAAHSVQRTFTIIALVSLFLAYAYDVHYTHAYFVTQLQDLLGHSRTHAAENAGLIDASVHLAIVGTIALTIVIWTAKLVRRRVRPRVAARPQTFWRYTYGAVIAATVISLAVFPLFGLWNSAWRWGPLLLILVAVGLIVIAQRPGRYVDAVGGLLLVLMIGAFAVLFARRVPYPKTQIYYLYFERYLFSEVIPAALLVAAMGTQAIVDTAKRFSPTIRAFDAALVGAVVVLLVGLVPQIDETRRVTQYQLLGDPYTALSRIDELTRTVGTGVIVYSGSRAPPEGWFFPNTYRAFVLPLEETFGRTVVGAQPGALSKDREFSPVEARLALTKLGRASGYLVALRKPGQLRFADGGTSRFIGTVVYECPSLGQTPDSPQPPWEVATLTFDVYAIS